MKQDNTTYYILAAIAAYYAWQWYKKQPMAQSTDQSNNVQSSMPTVIKTVTSAAPMQLVQTIQSMSDIAPVVKQIDQPTYQNYYGQIKGIEAKKVSHIC